MKSKQKLHGKSSNDFRFESCNQKDFNFVISGNDLTESIFEISCFKMSVDKWMTYMKNSRLRDVMSINKCQSIGMERRYSTNALMK